ncbi:MAG: hypothetical protein H7336_07770 [Bacteriovorax sp.]|nr:hypothetical protein [Bacteriovorax sp.]
MTVKRRALNSKTTKQRKLINEQPNQLRAPGEIQGFSKHTKPNKGQGRGQRVKASHE